MFKNRKGQSTVEYILLVTAVIAILIFFLIGANSPFRNAYNQTLDDATDGMQTMAGRLAGSHCSGTIVANGDCVFTP